MSERQLYYISWGLSFILVFFYKWRQFNTPSSNRSSTRQSLYWWSFIAYLAVITVVFIGVEFLFSTGVLKLFSGNLTSSGTLAPPLLAALALTTAPSSFEPLKILDEKILAQFHELARIPDEVTRQALEMNIGRLRILESDLPALAEFYRGDPKVRSHFKSMADSHDAHAEYRMTAVAKIFMVISKLSQISAYRKHFAHWSNDWEALSNEVSEFLFQSARGFELGARLEKLDPAAAREAYDELMEDRRRAFLLECNAIYRKLSDFLARALLRCETTESRIGARLRQAGFIDFAVKKSPPFPINGMTIFSLGMFLYFIGTYILNSNSQTPFPLDFAMKIFVVRVAVSSLVIWLSLQFPYFHRAQCTHDMKYFSYLTCGVLCSLVTLVLCMTWDIVDCLPSLSKLPFSISNLVSIVGPELRRDCSVVFISGVTGLALSLCCDDWLTPSSMPPKMHRIKEAALCGAGGALAAFLSVVMHISATSFPSSIIKAVGVVGLPGLMMVYSGFFLPHIYRNARNRSYRTEDATEENGRHDTRVFVENAGPGRSFSEGDEGALAGPRLVTVNSQMADRL